MFRARSYQQHPILARYACACMSSTYGEMDISNGENHDGVAAAASTEATTTSLPRTSVSVASSAQDARILARLMDILAPELHMCPDQNALKARWLARMAATQMIASMRLRQERHTSKRRRKRRRMPCSGDNATCA